MLTPDKDLEAIRKTCLEFAGKFYDYKNLEPQGELVDHLQGAYILTKGGISRPDQYLGVFAIARIITSEYPFILKSPDCNIIHPSYPYPGDVVDVDLRKKLVRVNFPDQGEKTLDISSVAQGATLMAAIQNYQAPAKAVLEAMREQLSGFDGISN